MTSLSERGTRGCRAAFSLVAAFAFGAALAAVANAENAPSWREVPMPPGFQVIVNELEGPVFADAEGRTLYEWPQHVLRNGYSGEALRHLAWWNRTQAQVNVAPSVQHGLCRREQRCSRVCPKGWLVIHCS